MNPSSISEGAPSRSLTVVVGLALGDADDAAFDRAARISARDLLSELHLIHVFDVEPSIERSRDIAARLRTYARRRAIAIGGLRGITTGVHLRSGPAVRAIVQLATEVEADVIVVGAHRGLHPCEWIVGSTARRLTAASGCPVVVANPWPADPSEPREAIIEPPCPDCVCARAATGGSEWWCERHGHRGTGALA